MSDQRTGVQGMPSSDIFGELPDPFFRPSWEDAPEETEEGPATPPSEDSKTKPVPEFSDEEYLIASPVVLGFAFAEKLWLEFTVSGVKEIQWNETAYESLVLEPKTKDIVKVC